MADVTVRNASDVLDELRGELRIGLQRQADVKLPHSEHRVRRAYCSALPVAYSRQRAERWTDFAKRILDATYEATLLAAVINASRTAVNIVYLTLLGGGVFGNENDLVVRGLPDKIANLSKVVAIDRAGSASDRARRALARVRLVNPGTVFGRHRWANHFQQIELRGDFE